MKVRLLAPAHRELQSAVAYYNHQVPGLGIEFREEAWAAIKRIKEFPEAWHPMGGSIRRCQLLRFPYGIIYEPSADEIVVVAIANLHRAPEYWRSRTT